MCKTCWSNLIFSPDLIFPLYYFMCYIALIASLIPTWYEPLVWSNSSCNFLSSVALQAKTISNLRLIKVLLLMKYESIKNVFGLIGFIHLDISQWILSKSSKITKIKRTKTWLVYITDASTTSIVKQCNAPSIVKLHGQSQTVITNNPHLHWWNHTYDNVCWRSLECKPATYNTKRKFMLE